MKTYKISLSSRISLIALCCILALPITGFTNRVLAAENKAINEQAIEFVNINQADAETMSRMLKGIGLKKAQAIIDWREKNGNFKNVEQLTQVKGIGQKTVEINRARIRF